MNEPMKTSRYYIHVLLASCLIGLCQSCAKTGRNTQQARGRTAYVQQRTTPAHPPTRPSNRANVSLPASERNTAMPATEIFERYNSAVFMIFTSDGYNVYQGSGFFINPDGLAVSNYHVFEDMSEAVIKLSDGRTFGIAEILAQSREDDFIVFRVEGHFNYIPVSNRTCKVGEKVYTIGSPQGLENTFSSGEISQIRDENFIQISCPIDHGSSGGALINSYGEAIGITTAGHEDSGANLNFAKDISLIRGILNRLSSQHRTK